MAIDVRSKSSLSSALLLASTTCRQAGQDKPNKQEIDHRSFMYVFTLTKLLKYESFLVLLVEKGDLLSQYLSNQ